MKRTFLLLCSLVLLAPAFAADRHPKGAEPLRIGYGEQVNLADYLVPGKTTVFDFTSKFCPPCRGYDQPLIQLHQQRSDLVVVKVDINRAGVKGIDWESPVSQQYGLANMGIPHFKIYGPDGKLIAEDTTRPAPARAMVNQWLSALK